MKFLAENIFLVALAVTSGLMLLWPMLKRGAGGVASATPAEAVLLINRSNALVLDVREDAEFAAGHIMEAKHIPLSQLAGRIEELKKHKNKPILVNCQHGVRSGKACDILKKHEFAQVHYLEGGLEAWAKAKLPVVRE